MKLRSVLKLCRRVSPVTFLLFTWINPDVQAGDISGIVSFGDSLTDTGNLYTATGQPAAPYYDGRFSNGSVWVEYLANQLGVAAPTASLLGGTNYAWAGAATGDGVNADGIPNTGLQISTYLASNTPTASQLFTLWAGANDFLAFGQTDPSVPVANIANEITTLANAGAKLVMVPNLPMLGDLPGTNTLPQSDRDALDQLSSSFDSLLHSELGVLRQSLGITIFEPDINSFLQSAIANPAQYGFTDVTTSALGDGVLSGQGYLFWDEIHPTTAGHQLVADVAAASMVPEPASMILMVTGLGAVSAGSMMRRGRRGFVPAAMRFN
jgi:phospholipase/lecithinase/hemolysin